MQIPHYIQSKYLLLYSPRLDQFKKQREDLYNCRCPICGDSAKNKFKRRGYFYLADDGYAYKCHNCGYANSFPYFLKEHDHNLFMDMVREVLQSELSASVDFVDEPTITTLPYQHSARMQALISKQPSFLDTYRRVSTGDGVYSQYLQSRAIPEKYYRRFFAIPNISEFVSNIPTYQDSNIAYPHAPAIGIPYFNGQSLAYMQMRNLSATGLRYMTFEVDGGYKVFGLNEVDFTQRISILEGAFDSIFVHNAVSNAGASDISNMRYLAKIARGGIRYIYDMDYKYNPQIRKMLDQRIAEGYDVVIFDSGFKWKDINEAIQSGQSEESINAYLDQRTFRGLRASLELSKLA